MPLVWPDQPFSCGLVPSAQRGHSPVGVGVLVSQTITLPIPCMQFQATLCWNHESLPLLVLVDYGNDENFLDSNVSSASGWHFL